MTIYFLSSFVNSANTTNKNNAYLSRSMQHVSSIFYGHNMEVIILYKRYNISGTGLSFTSSKYNNHY